MGIQVEFNPDLALRNMQQHEKGLRKAEECIPRDLEAGRTYAFLKKGQRNYWLMGELPLLETKGDQVLSRPIASIRILSATHSLMDGEVYTHGEYEVMEVFDDSDVHFDGFARIRKQSSE